jgi:hypothetical protein
MTNRPDDQGEGKKLTKHQTVDIPIALISHHVVTVDYQTIDHLAMQRRWRQQVNVNYKRANTLWLGIMIMYPGGATCLTVFCFFSELVLLKSNKACWSSIKWTSSSSHWNVSFCCHDYSCNITHLALSNNHSLTYIPNFKETIYQ